MKHSKLLFFCAALSSCNGDNVCQDVVFHAGEGGYSNFRIPSLVQVSDRVLLATCEGRYSFSDNGNIDIVGKLSFDNGNSWSDLFVVCDVGDDTCGNPTVTVAGDKIYIASNWNPWWADMKAMQSGEVRDGVKAMRKTQIQTAFIKDGKLIVSELSDITSQVAREGINWDAAGPGNGILLSSGDIAVPVIGGMIVSSDGVTWNRDKFKTIKDKSIRTISDDGVPSVWTNESSLAQFENGDLLYFARPSVAQIEDYSKIVYRKPYSVGKYSADLGRYVWENFKFVEDLHVPGHYCEQCDETSRSCSECYATCVDKQNCEFRAPDACHSSVIIREDVIYFSSPSSTKERSNLKICSTRDPEKHWECTQITDGSSGYSSLSSCGDEICVLYETRSKPEGCNFVNGHDIVIDRIERVK